MTVITFTEDVTLESECQENGPHYRKGYAPDVSAKEAQKWVSKGVAVFGKPEKADVAPQPLDVDSGGVAVEDSAPKVAPRKSRRKRGWTPLDEESGR